MNDNGVREVCEFEAINSRISLVERILGTICVEEQWMLGEELLRKPITPDSIKRMAEMEEIVRRNFRRFEPSTQRIL